MRKGRNLCAMERPPEATARGSHCKPRRGSKVWEHKDMGFCAHTFSLHFSPVEVTEVIRGNKGAELTGNQDSALWPRGAA